MQARWTHSTSIKCVPLVATGAKPSVLFARRPAAKRAADAWRFRSAELPFFKLAVWNDDRIVGDHSHAGYYDRDVAVEVTAPLENPRMGLPQSSIV
jgi:hypothetical protein